MFKSRLQNVQKLLTKCSNLDCKSTNLLQNAKHKEIKIRKIYLFVQNNNPPIAFLIDNKGGL